MNKRLFVGFFFGIVFLFSLNFILAQDCLQVGQIDYSTNQYCDSNLVWQNLKEQGVVCVNNYECEINSCKEGICKSEFEGIQDTQKWYGKIWDIIYFWEEEPPVEYCGNGLCDYGETNLTCPVDCGDICGNGVCDNNETCSTCEIDCGACGLGPFCGDGWCNGNEDCHTCNDDCGNCPNGGGGGSRRTVVNNSNINCGDGVCDLDESCSVCSEDCGNCPISLTSESECGDGECGDDEDSDTCAEDCSSESGSLWWLWLLLIILILGVLAFIGYVLYKKKTAGGESNVSVSGKELPKYPPKSEISLEAKPKPALEKPKLIIPEVSSVGVK